MEFSKLAGVAAGAGLATLSGAVFVARPWHQRWGASDAEVQRPMAGDDEVRRPMHVTTRAATIHATPGEVWPWLAQMGYQRAGLYGYDWIDKLMGILDENSTWEILPEFQRLGVSDVIPMGSEPSWPVIAAEPGRLLVLRILEPGVDVTWSYLFEGLDGGRTRLVLRIRTWLEVTPRLIPLLLTMDPGEFFMVRRHRLGIKERAEAPARRWAAG